jgi:hypothetical protein
MDDLSIGQRLALPYESQDKSISVAAEITGLGLPAVRVETDSGEVFIRHAERVTDWTTTETHHA